MKNVNFLKELVFGISEVGSKNGFEAPNLHKIDPFKDFFDEKGNIKLEELDQKDGKYTRKELLSRYLLLNAVLDQGPDIKGVRILLENTVNTLYSNNIKIFHEPIVFFKKFDFILNQIITEHDNVKKSRSVLWADKNNSNPNKYKLFFAQSMRGIVSNSALDYVVHRWGVPLSLLMLLETDNGKSKVSNSPLVDFLEKFDSSEILSNKLKKNSNYGLGSAIGNKACHLFVKWYLHTFNLVSKKDPGWSKWSYEVPLDSNAGRVLFRTGFLQNLADLSYYENQEVIKKNSKKNYIRVTNIREKKVQVDLGAKIKENYNEVVLRHLKINRSKPQKLQIQLVPNAILLNSNYGIGNFDDGLMYLGINYCSNNENPDCMNCPINYLCKGKNEDTSLIRDYTT